MLTCPDLNTDTQTIQPLLYGNLTVIPLRRPSLKLTLKIAILHQNEMVLIAKWSLFQEILT